MEAQEYQRYAKNTVVFTTIELGTILHKHQYNSYRARAEEEGMLREQRFTLYFLPGLSLPIFTLNWPKHSGMRSNRKNLERNHYQINCIGCECLR